MSQWTHVAAVIRFDCMRNQQFPDGVWLFDGPDPVPQLDFDIPYGSEGPLQMELWTNPEVSCMDAYTLTIWGDLRDWDSVDGIIEYLERITSHWCKSDRTSGIRAGVAYIDVEGHAPVIAHCVGEAGWVRATV